MPDHALLHGTDTAYCRQSWDKMPGTDRVRQCPYCKTVAFKLDDLSQEQVTTLLSASGRDGETAKLSRRFDGTFVTHNMPCGINAWRYGLKRWPSALSLVCHRLFGSGGLGALLAFP
jgi:hypothetical protein